MTKKHEDGFRLNRRDLLKGAASVSLASALSPLTEIRATSTKVNHDLIRAENEKLGTTDWLLQNTRVDRKTRYRCPWIEGYCSHTSIREGDQLRIMVSTDPPEGLGWTSMRHVPPDCAAFASSTVAVMTGTSTRSARSTRCRGSPSLP